VAALAVVAAAVLQLHPPKAPSDRLRGMLEILSSPGANKKFRIINIRLPDQFIEPAKLVIDQKRLAPSNAVGAILFAMNTLPVKSFNAIL
jgi:hypothetical protein